MKNILVTGATGGMGSAISKSLLKKGYRVFGIDYKEGEKIDGLNFFNCDVTDTESVCAVMEKIRETGLLEKSRKLIKEKKLTFADQSAVYRSTTKKKMLPQRFNDQKFLHKHTVVRHFSKRLFWLPYPHTENIKQWQVERVHKVFGYHQFDDIFDEYLELVKTFKGE